MIVHAEMNSKAISYADTNTHIRATYSGARATATTISGKNNEKTLFPFQAAGTGTGAEESGKNHRSYCIISIVQSHLFSVSLKYNIGDENEEEDEDGDRVEGSGRA